MDQLTLERIILGTVLAYGSDALERVDILKPDDFSASAHGEIFRACVRLNREGMPVDIATVGAELSGNSAAIGALAQLDGTESLASLEGYAVEIRRLATIRAIGKCAQEIVYRSRELRSGTSATLNDLEQLITRLVTARSNRDASVISLREIADEHLDMIDRVARGEPPPLRIRTGLRDVDRKLGGGFDLGTLAVFGGATSSGKSSLAGQVAVYAATRNPPIPVAFITAEMTHQQMLARFVAAETRVPVATILSPRAAEPHRGAIDQIGNYPIFFQKTFPPTIEQAQATIRLLARREGVKLAVIDYVQHLASLDEEAHEREVARIIVAAKNLALELGIVVVACAQVNRQPSARADARPRLSDLRASGQLEQEGDYVVFTHQPELYGKMEPPEIIVAKQRNGPRGSVIARWDAIACRFDDVPEGRQP